MLTPTEREARAREITDDEPWLSFAQCLRIHAKIAAALTREYEAGARAEREACARIADSWRAAGHEDDCGCALCGIARGIARALRARDATPPTSKEMT